MELWSRRKFFLSSVAGSVVAGAGKLFGRTAEGSGSVAALYLAWVLTATEAAAKPKRLYHTILESVESRRRSLHMVANLLARASFGAYGLTAEAGREALSQVEAK